MFAVASLMLTTVAAVSQTAGATAIVPLQLSPAAAYEQAMHPLVTTRTSITNWSDTEVAALTVAIGNAAKACATRDARDFSGSDLLDLAKLCALGQNWAAVVTPARLYLAAEGAKPQLTRAYWTLVDAELHLKDEQAALADAQAMLAAVPYDALTAETVDEALEFMQFVYTSDALTLATAREPMLLARMQAEVAPATPEAGDVPLAVGQGMPSQPLHELYADGVSFAALQQLSKSPATESAATIAVLDAALPATMTPDDAIPVAATRQRYALLGRPLPKVHAMASLSLPGRIPQLPASRAITALLLFPDWCAQCIRMAYKFPPSVFSVEHHEAYLYGLLAETVPHDRTPSRQVDAKVPKAFTPADAESMLRETPTLTVGPETLEQFAATDVPYLILTDARGIVRVLQPVAEDAVDPSGTVDSAIARVGTQWPLLPPPGGPVRLAPGVKP